MVAQFLPDSAGAGYVGLAAQLAVRADLAGHSRQLGGDAAEQVLLGVEDVLHIEKLAPRLAEVTFRQVAARHRGRDLAGFAHLRCHVAHHEVDVIAQFLPDSADAGHVGLAAQPALGTDLTGHAGHLAGERIKLVHHRVDRLAQVEELAFQRRAVDLQAHLFRQVSLGDGADDPGDCRRGPDQVVDEVVERLDADRPATAGAGDGCPLRDLALLADDLAHPRELGGGAVEQVHGVIER